jgi:hypothetical protein
MATFRHPFIAAALATLLLGGCMSKPLLPVRADGSHCFRDGNELRGKRTCTPAAVPAAETEADARRYSASPNDLTVYVVRQRWGDNANVVTVDDGRGHEAATVPRSFARLRLAPGTHRLTARWQGGQAAFDIRGGAGEVLTVELVGSVWSWGSSYRLEAAAAPAQAGPVRVANLRLVADLGADAADVRRTARP